MGRYRKNANLRSKNVAALLALFLGGFGIHRFYLGKVGSGLLYLMFCWTGVPSVIAIITAIYYFFLSKESFDKRYNE